MLLLLLISAIFCHSPQKDYAEEYFSSLTDELLTQPKKAQAVKNRELAKYKKTGDRKYLIGSRYAGFYEEGTELKIEQIPLIYDLLLFNDDESNYMTVQLNFILAHRFIKYSPQMAMGFVNKAIQSSENGTEKKILPRLYSFKGVTYYRTKNYSEALVYFKKALKIISSNHEDLPFVASMHNNIGLAYEKKGELNLALKEMHTAIQILESLKNLNKADHAFLINVKANSGLCYYKLKKYDNAESLLLEEYYFNKGNKDFKTEAVENIVELFKVYDDTGQNAKMQELMKYGIYAQSQVKNISDKILLNEMFQSYYFRIDEVNKLENVNKTLIALHTADDKLKQKDFTGASDILNRYIIKELNLKQKEAIDREKLNNRLSIAAAGVFIIILGGTIYFIRNANKREKELAEKEKVILIKNKRILEQDVKEREEKISRMHLNLNLKIETEKTFLEHIKKIKKAKNTDSEQAINDLFVRINNLIRIDKNNSDLISESSAENKLLINKLSKQFPDLTHNDIKFCIYYKLDLSSKEVAILENITEGSVRVYKTRIKSKMNIGKEADLNLFLKNM
ncbi:tetratricopeptide repeat protein [Chryseobacterium herbae]|uniref:Tetratricopeptide repeat protein n=1 Tax=Chryseobacterium herbae TaxID=2976476 RepID=A0ABT2ISS5_9FLAO|nr:tetratricopeptide repeat protein [Chryseobacterium sp. pc1-10]MCT2561885.1 tetratricopeptide repeat protein [Chryseobacterium sp. pc1-10]